MDRNMTDAERECAGSMLALQQGHQSTSMQQSSSSAEQECAASMIALHQSRTTYSVSSSMVLAYHIKDGPRPAPSSFKSVSIETLHTRKRPDAAAANGSSPLESHSPAKTYDLPSFSQMPIRTKENHRFLSIPSASRSLPGLADRPGSFNPATFKLHGICGTQTPAAPDPPAGHPKTYGTLPFNLAGLRSALSAIVNKPKAIVKKPVASDKYLEEVMKSIPKPRPVRGLPSVPKPRENPFFASDMDVGAFATRIKQSMDDALSSTQKWNHMLEIQFEKRGIRTKMVDMAMDILCIAQVLTLGRIDWDLTSLPISFFDEILPIMEEVDALADEIANKKGCSWMREMAARPCFDARLVLKKAKDKNVMASSSEGRMEMEKKAWESSQRRKSEASVRSGWQGEPM